MAESGLSSEVSRESRGKYIKRQKQVSTVKRQVKEKYVIKLLIRTHFPLLSLDTFTCLDLILPFTTYPPFLNVQNGGQFKAYLAPQGGILNLNVSKLICSNCKLAFIPLWLYQHV